MNRHSDVANHISRLRSSELLSVDHLLKSDMYVLEIGGGNGFQANKISERGCKIKSIDLQNRDNMSKYFDVTTYDGITIPFEIATFDIVFSSNVLEHVIDINNVLNEIKRVLKPSGVVICIMPTASWRCWTIISHYVYLMALTVKRLFDTSRKVSESMCIIPPPHGEYKSCFHEIYFYSAYSWNMVFEKNGLKVINSFRTNFFCTGYAIFPNMGLRVRKILSHAFGSAGNIFVLQIKL